MKAKKTLIAAAAIVALLMVLFAYLWISIMRVSSSAAPQVTPGRIISSVSLNSSAVLSYNNTNNYAAYALVSYHVSNATNVSVRVDTYTRNPVQRIYLLNVSAYCESCFNETSLAAALSSDLSYRGLMSGNSLPFVNLAAANSIPRNSTVIVPSGILPLSLVNNTKASIFAMLDKGDTVVYVGTDFSRELGSYKVISYASPSLASLFALYNMSTINYTPPQKGFNAENLSFRGPTFQFAYGPSYGNVTYVNSRNGTIVAFPDYPTTGWKNVSSMAGDMANVIDLRFWLNDTGSGSRSFTPSQQSVSGRFGVIANITRPGRQSLMTPLELANSTYSLVTVVASNRSSSVTTELSFKDRYNWNGTVEAPQRVGEGQVFPVRVSPNNVIGENKNIRLQIEVFDLNMTHIQFISMGTGTFTPGTFYGVNPSFSMPSGYHLLALEGYAGYKYAEAYFYLANATITPTAYDFKNNTFLFSLYSNNLPVSNATYTISMDGAYLEKSTVSNGTLTYQLPRGTTVPYGSHSFTIDIFGNSYTMNEQYVETYLYIPAIDWEFGIAAIVIVFLNLILKPPNRDEYYIDVPPFPPVKKEKVGVPTTSLLGVFDKVNYYYHWNYMPLNVEEVRLGINSNIRINNMPVSVTTQNADAILAKLAAAGDLVSALGYFAPKAWTSTSGHDIEYLLIFRKLRDHCVTHTILFTDIDMEKGMDMIITKEGKQSNLFIYSTGSRPKKVLLSQGSRSFLVFLDETKKQEFINRLYDSLGEEAETLKLGIEYNYLVLIDCDHLDQLAM